MMICSLRLLIFLVQIILFSSTTTAKPLLNPECYRAVRCKLTHGDIVKFGLGLHTYAGLYSQATDIGYLATKFQDPGVQFHNCTQVLYHCEIQVMEEAAKMTQMSREMLDCGWETFAYMIFHCRTLVSWPFAAKKLLDSYNMGKCEELSSCNCCFDEFAKFEHALPSDWKKRQEAAQEELKQGLDAVKAHAKLKKSWPTREQLILIAEAGTNVIKIEEVTKGIFKGKEWLMCEPGTYMTKYSFALAAHSHCRNYFDSIWYFFSDLSYVVQYDYVIQHNTLNIECASLDGRHVNKQFPTRKTSGWYMFTVNSTNFFTGIVYADHNQRSSYECMYHVAHFVMSKGYIDAGGNLTTIGLPITIPLLPEDNPAYSRDNGHRRSLKNTEFQNSLKKAKYDLRNQECKNGLVICGLQPASRHFGPMVLDSISVFCCRPQYYCVRSTHFAEIYRDEPIDLTKDDQGPLKAFAITTGKQVSKSGTRGGSRSTTLSHTIAIEASVSAGGAEGALGGSVTSTYSFTHSSTDEENWSKTLAEVDHSTQAQTVTYRLVYGALNTFYQVQVQCGLIDVLLKEIMHVVIVQGGVDYCNAEVKWIYQTTYGPTDKVINLPFGANFSHPAQKHLNVKDGGAPYLDVEVVTKSFLHRFATDSELNEPLVPSRSINLETVMKNYTGRQFKEPLKLTQKDGTPLPTQGFLFQQVGVCNHRALPEKYTFTAYTDNLRAIEIPSEDCVATRDTFEIYDSYHNFHATTMTHVRKIVHRGLSVRGRPKELVIPEDAIDKFRSTIKKVQAQFKKLGKSKTTGIDWVGVTNGQWHLETSIERPMTVSVPPEGKLVFYELLGQCGNWEYRYDIDAYEIIKNGCVVTAEGFHTGFGVNKKCNSLGRAAAGGQKFSCVPEERFRRTSPKTRVNLGEVSERFTFSFGVGTVDTTDHAAKVPLEHHEYLMKTFSSYGVGNLTSFPWNKLTASRMESGTLKSSTREIEIPAEHVAEVFQVVGICGKYQVFMNVVYTKFSKYMRTFQGGDEWVGGTGPFEDPDFTFGQDALLKD